MNLANSRERLRVLPSSSKQGTNSVCPMSQQRRRSISLSFLLISSVFLAAFTPIASADSRILLDLSNDHVVLIQGDSTNVTLTIENNDTSNHDFTLRTDATATATASKGTFVDQNISTVLPTFSVTTSIIVHLANDADLSDSGSIDIHVAHSGSNGASSITLYLSVAPSYLPAVEHTVVGDCLLYTSPSPRDQRGSRIPGWG